MRAGSNPPAAAAIIDPTTSSCKIVYDGIGMQLLLMMMNSRWARYEAVWKDADSYLMLTEIKWQQQEQQQQQLQQDEWPWTVIRKAGLMVEFLRQTCQVVNDLEHIIVDADLKKNRRMDSFENRMHFLSVAYSMDLISALRLLSCFHTCCIVLASE